MRKQYDDFTQMKIKEMCKSISDMTFPTKMKVLVHILNQVLI